VPAEETPAPAVEDADGETDGEQLPHSTDPEPPKSA